MKRLLPFVFILAIIHAAILNVCNSAQTTGSTLSEYNLSLSHQSLMKPGIVSRFAWQADPAVAPIEETKQVSWWWWVIGVILILGGGMLLYVLIKKNPRKDA